MEIRPIRTNDDLTAALARIDALWGKEPGTPEGDELDILVDLVEHYEGKHFPVEPMEPIDLLKAHMETTARTQADLAALLGSRPRASEVLNRKRALTVDMIHKLSSEWHIPADCLVKPYHLAAAE
ncbi:type II toxin-antitoxin system HigA family antitoxin [Roseinatronobacter sp. S2]|uniref:helix-turn-helix domain-containing protein n=1 Tax=Roseinatronobacter sp. S2 TaxID=3035471 RepID=UPI002410A310|nr:transcriptional regulator [Roseinatronobacter sp. S2]WFE75241.1 transcriptional regulator [Roseinatronobacter sp. S2]